VFADIMFSLVEQIILIVSTGFGKIPVVITGVAVVVGIIICIIL